MNTAQALRISFQVAAFAVFIFQAQQSLVKFFQYPVVIQQSSLTLEEIEKPDIYIYNLGTRYNFVLGQKMGYKYFSKFLAGKIDNKSYPTWKGIQGIFKIIADT